MRLSKKNSTKKALIWIAFFTLFVSGGAAFTLLYMAHLRALQGNDPAFRIVAIDHKALSPFSVKETGQRFNWSDVRSNNSLFTSFEESSVSDEVSDISAGQKSEIPHPGSLSTDYLAELLEISVDIPTYLPHFNVQAGVDKLLKSPVIQAARIKKIQPNALWIEYIVRQPVVKVIDWEEAALDEEGVLIPLKSIYEEGMISQIPEIVLGDLDSLEWGCCVQAPRVALAFAIAEELKEREERVRVDVSRAEERSFGKREVVVFFLSSSICLRLDADHWREGLANFEKLEEIQKAEREQEYPFTKERKCLMIDLRLKDLAFIKNII